MEFKGIFQGDMTMQARKFQRGDVNKPNSGGGSLTEKDVLNPPVRIINAICHFRVDIESYQHGS